MKEKNIEQFNQKNAAVTGGPAGEEANTIAKIQRFIEEKRNLVIGVSIAVIVLVVGVFLLNNYLKKQAVENESAASFALSKVVDIYLANDYQKALDGDKTILVDGRPMLGLKEIADKYDGTKPAQIAALYAAESLVSLGKHQEAEKYLKQAAESEAAVIKEGAYAGLGVCSEVSGNYEEALNNYEKAIAYSKNPGTKNRYMYFQGLCYEKLGRKDEAEKLYKDIIAENTSEFVALAKGGLARLAR